MTLNAAHIRRIMQAPGDPAANVAHWVNVRYAPLIRAKERKAVGDDLYAAGDKAIDVACDDYAKPLFGIPMAQFGGED